MKLEHVKLVQDARETLAVVDESLAPLVEEAKDKDIPLFLLKDAIGRPRAQELFRMRVDLLHTIALLETS